MSWVSKTISKVAPIAAGAAMGYYTGGASMAAGTGKSWFEDNSAQLITAGASIYGGMQANTANSAQAQRAMDFSARQAEIARGYNANQAQKQRTFQRKMSNTAHTREVKDLIRAGLNPILAAGGAGASSPGGAMGSSPSPSGAQANMQDVITPAMNTAVSMERTRAEIDRIEEDTRKLVHETASAFYNQKGANWTAIKAKYEALMSEISWEQAEVMLDIARQELKLMTRRGEIAETEAGVVLQWIQEFTSSVLGGGSLIPRR